MRMINSSILVLLSGINFLNASASENILQSLQDAEKRLFKGQLEILKVDGKQYEKKIKEFFEQEMKGIRNEIFNPDHEGLFTKELREEESKKFLQEKRKELTPQQVKEFVDQELKEGLDPKEFINSKNKEKELIMNSIDRIHSIMKKIANLQDQMQEYKVGKDDVKLKNIELMKKSLNSINTSLEDYKEDYKKRFNSDFLEKIYELKSFVKKESLKNDTQVSIAYATYIKYGLLLFAGIILIIILIYFVGLIYKIIGSMMILFILYLLYNYLFK